MSYTCLRCRRTSHNPNDEREKYCGNCHLFEEDVAQRQLRGLVRVADDWEVLVWGRALRGEVAGVRFLDFWRQLGQAQVRAYRSADRLNKCLLVFSWVFMAWVALSFIFPVLEIPLWLFLLFLGAIMFNILRETWKQKRDFAKFKKFYGTMQRAHEVVQRGGTEDDLSPEDREELMVWRAKHRLDEGP